MPLKQDYSNITDVLTMVQKAQDSEQEQRDHAREAKRFIVNRDGQWDDYAIQKMDGRFRGTFDMCGPIVDGIAGEIEQADFTIRVSPSGGRASKETAKVLDGLIRNIRNISNAEEVFNSAARSCIIGGFDCWEVVQDWVDGDSFDQDLFIRRVPDAVNSVWFDLSSVKQDRSDANWAFKLVDLPKSEYDERFPEGSGLSVGENKRYDDDCNYNSKETVKVGKFYYRKPRTIELVRMTDGTVYEDDEKFQSIKDELAEQGITIEMENGEEKRRTRKSWRVYSRMFDGGGWLKPEEETVFDFIPLIPIYGNFDIVDKNTIYFGKIEKLFDSQRVLNYALSRDIEDGALSPSPTIWMTDEMAEGNDYSDMNTSRDPVRIFNTDSQNPGLLPTYTGGPQQSQGLQTTIQNTMQMINVSSNTFNAQQGNANAQQSGIAGLQQIEQGNIGNMKWFKALEVAICHTGKVLINAIPKVYDATRQIRILDEDGTVEIETINKTVFDTETGKNVVMNDLSVGEYDVVCEVGPAFNSAQKEAARSIEAMLTAAPEISPVVLDVLFSNKKEPGMDIIAERLREQAFVNNMIPEKQWTDEEIAKVQEQQALAAQQPPQEDPMMVAARAEEAKAQADMANAQVKQAEVQSKQQIEIAKIQLEQQKIQLDAAKFERDKSDKYNVDLISADQNQQKIDLQAQKQMQELALKLTELEQRVGEQLNAEVEANLLVFNPLTGEFE